MVGVFETALGLKVNLESMLLVKLISIWKEWFLLPASFGCSSSVLHMYALGGYTEERMEF